MNLSKIYILSLSRMNRLSCKTGLATSLLLSWVAKSCSVATRVIWEYCKYKAIRQVPVPQAQYNSSLLWTHYKKLREHNLLYTRLSKSSSSHRTWWWWWWWLVNQVSAQYTLADSLRPSLASRAGPASCGCVSVHWPQQLSCSCDRTVSTCD